MRKHFLLFPGFFLTVVCLNATVHTVSNDPNKPAQFTSPTTALAAAAPGDTLYIYGSPTSYGDFVINKDVTIIGAGNNTRKDVFYKTVFRFFDLTGTTRSNVTVDGIYCEQFRIQPGITLNYSNITIRNTIVLGSFSGIGGSPVNCGSSFSNWVIENCYIQSYNEPVNGTCNPISPVKSGFLLRNTIITNINPAYASTFVNCHFGADGGAANNFIGQRDNLFNNCTFYKMNFIQNTSNINNQFNNCLTYLTNTPSQTFDLNNWTGGATGSANNCIINQNPLWVTALSLTNFSNTDPAIRNSWNPAVNAGSPVINAGSDGTDIGLTGGSVPYNVGAEPKIPVMRRYQLVNAVVPPSGTVTVNATATKAQ